MPQGAFDIPADQLEQGFASSGYAQLHRDQVRNMLGGILAGAGIGGLVAGVPALAGFFRDRTTPPVRTPMRRTVIRVPAGEEEDDAPGPLAKAASAMAAAVKSADEVPWSHDALNRVTAFLSGVPGQPRTPLQESVFPEVASKGDYPLGMAMKYLPAAAAAIATRGLVSNFFKGRRDDDRKQQLDDARSRYEAALAGRKMASVYEELREHREEVVEKSASLVDQLTNAWTMGLLTAGAAGAYGTYKMMDAASPEKALRQAVRRREEELAVDRPAPIYVTTYKPRRRQAQIEGPKAASFASAVIGATSKLDQRRQYWQQVMQANQAGGKSSGKPAAPAPPAPTPPPTLTA